MKRRCTTKSFHRSKPTKAHFSTQSLTPDDIYELFLGHGDTPGDELDDLILAELGLRPEYNGLN